MSTRSLAEGGAGETLTALPLADLHTSTGRRGDRAFGLALRLVAGRWRVFVTGSYDSFSAKTPETVAGLPSPPNT